MTRPLHIGGRGCARALRQSGAAARPAGRRSARARLAAAGAAALVLTGLAGCSSDLASLYTGELALPATARAATRAADASATDAERSPRLVEVVPKLVDLLAKKGEVSAREDDEALADELEAETEAAAAVEAVQEFQEVALIAQEPELPNGCEVTSLAMLLAAAGYPIDKVELFETYLAHEEIAFEEGGWWSGPSPEEAYAGDAATVDGGWYCFQGPIVAAGDAWIDVCGGASAMEDLTGLEQTELDGLLADGVPVVVWVTRDYAPPVRTETFSWVLPSGEEYTPYTNLHCVVVAGKGEGQYRIADPLLGWQDVDRDTFWASFDAMGRRAVTVVATAEDG